MEGVGKEDLHVALAVWHVLLVVALSCL